MVRFFNTTGICFPDKHFMLPPLPRLPELRALIDRELYFVLHAPRQSGKSTSLHALAQVLTQEGQHAAVLLSMEPGVAFPNEIGAAEHAILQRWRSAADAVLPAALRPPAWPEAPPGSRIAEALTAWSVACPRKLVIFLDEIDALPGEVLISVLRQLREGSSYRPSHFPAALGLCGMRDVRDYKIKVASLTMQNFTRDEVAALYAQHTDETGQVFLPETVELAHRLSGGQPWLVNALAGQMVDVLSRDRTRPLTPEHVYQAKELLIQRRDTHLDSLAERLHDPRVRRVIEPILIGADQGPMDIMNDDIVYVRDLGLITDRPQVMLANPIYQELIPRALTYVMQSYLTQDSAWYVRPDGKLDMVLLLVAFQEFFVQHSESWLGRFDYEEAGPHLLLMAFLQRIINGGGRISREFALGAGRADLIVEYGGGRSVVELKLRRGDDTRDEGVVQLGGYLDRLGEAEGHLVIFDRRKTVRWADKFYFEEVAGPAGQRIYVHGA